MKPVVWLGDSQSEVRTFPKTVKVLIGRELMAIQNGLTPGSWKPMKTIGTGVRELRVSYRGQFRVIYLTHIGDQVHILHAFQKKTQRTLKGDIDKARDRLKELLKEQRSGKDRRK